MLIKNRGFTRLIIKLKNQILMLKLVSSDFYYHNESSRAYTKNLRIEIACQKSSITFLFVFLSELELQDLISEI
jgi:hypothetical protein